MSSVRATGAGKEEAELNQSDGEQVLARNTLLMGQHDQFGKSLHFFIDIAHTIL